MAKKRSEPNSLIDDDFSVITRERLHRFMVYRWKSHFDDNARIVARLIEEGVEIGARIHYYPRYYRSGSRIGTVRDHIIYGAIVDVQGLETVPHLLAPGITTKSVSQSVASDFLRQYRQQCLEEEFVDGAYAIASIFGRGTTSLLDSQAEPITSQESDLVIDEVETIINQDVGKIYWPRRILYLPCGREMDLTEQPEAEELPDNIREHWKPKQSRFRKFLPSRRRLRVEVQGEVGNAKGSIVFDTSKVSSLYESFDEDLDEPDEE